MYKQASVRQLAVDMHVVLWISTLSTVK